MTFFLVYPLLVKDRFSDEAQPIEHTWDTLVGGLGHVGPHPSNAQIDALEAVTAELQRVPFHFLVKTIKADPDGAHVCQ